VGVGVSGGAAVMVLVGAVVGVGVSAEVASPVGVAEGGRKVGGGGKVGAATAPNPTCIPSLIIAASLSKSTPRGIMALISGSSASHR